MSLDNVNFAISIEEIERDGTRLGGGCYGTVYALGDFVYKIGAVSQDEADNLNEANDRMGGTFPRAVLIRNPDWGAEGILAMERIHGIQLCDFCMDEDGFVDYSMADMYLFEIRDILHQYGIRHQDLHSGNVMVTPEGWLRVVDGGMMSFYTPGEDYWTVVNGSW
jgi:hypothetical protein